MNETVKQQYRTYIYMFPIKKVAQFKRTSIKRSKVNLKIETRSNISNYLASQVVFILSKHGPYPL